MQRTGRYKLDLSDDPIEDAPNTRQVFARTCDAAGNTVIHHAVFNVPRIAGDPIAVFERLENWGRQLRLEILACRRFEQIILETCSLEEMIQFLNGLLEMLPSRLKCCSPDQIH